MDTSYLAAKCRFDGFDAHQNNCFEETAASKKLIEVSYNDAL